MLKRSQYLLSLIIGVIVFFAVFAVAYLYIGYTSTNENSELSTSKNERSVSTIGQIGQEETNVCIMPSTEVTLQVIDAKSKIIEKIKVASNSLLGLDELEIGERFSDYEITKFTEKEVVLTKKLDIDEPNKEMTYHLGISEDYICIIPDEASREENVIKLNLQASEFSSSAYSLLLNGKITISADERQALINKPDEIERILQVYDVN